jgi:hypothetical protein
VTLNQGQNLVHRSLWPISLVRIRYLNQFFIIGSSRFKLQYFLIRNFKTVLDLVVYEQKIHTELLRAHYL